MDPHPSRSVEQLIRKRPDTAWQLVKFYWHSKQPFPAYLFFSIVGALTVSLVGLNLFFTYWYYYFYDVLATYDKHGALRLGVVLFTVAVFYSSFALYRFYLQDAFRSGFISRGLLFFNKHFKSTNKRMQREMMELVHFSLDLSLGLIGTITTFLVFIYFLWQLALEFENTLWMTDWVVWIGVVYGLAGIFLTLKFGRPLGAFLDRKEKKQKCWRWFRTIYYQGCLVLPIFAVVPGYFYKVIVFSWFIQSLQAFKQVQGSLSSIVKKKC